MSIGNNPRMRGRSEGCRRDRRPIGPGGAAYASPGLFPYLCVALLVSSTVAAPGIRAQAQPTDVVVVEIVTSEGHITAEIYPDRAPVTGGNFLAYVDDALFDGGSFFRTVRMDNQPNDSVRIEVIQGGPDGPAVRDRLRAAIPLERTRDSGLAHDDGALSMARGSPDSGRAQFFICIGDQPSLDYGGNRNLDGQGFAVFGRVVAGMDVVRRIQNGAAEGQRLVEPVRIETIRRQS